LSDELGMEAVSDVKQRDADLASSGLPLTLDEVVAHARGT